MTRHARAAPVTLGTTASDTLLAPIHEFRGTLSDDRESLVEGEPFDMTVRRTLNHENDHRPEWPHE